MEESTNDGTQLWNSPNELFSSLPATTFVRTCLH